MAGRKKNYNSVLTPDDIRSSERRKQAEVVLKESGSLAKMSERQKNLAVEMVSHPEKTFEDQCRGAGYSVGPKNKMSGVKRNITGKMGKTLEEAGIFECDLGRVFAEGLSATKPVIIKKLKRDVSGKIIGETIEITEVPDHSTRAHFLKLALQTGSYFPAKEIKHSGKVEYDYKISKFQQIVESIPLEVLEREIRQIESTAVDAKVEIIEEDESCQSAA